MRANIDELADQILDIIERHIRMDPDDEGDPGEAARRIITDIIAPIANGEDMTTIDHAQESREYLEIADEMKGVEEFALSDLAIKQAQAHATLALAEQARIANLIELANNAARMATEGKSDMATYLDLFHKVNPVIMEGVGL